MPGLPSGEIFRSEMSFFSSARSRGENERRIGPVERALGGDDCHRRGVRLGALGERFLELLRQHLVDAALDQVVDQGGVGSGFHGAVLQQISV
jgi:hypothetical protein